MKAYCLNLDRRPDRWAHMQREADAAGFGLQRISATDAQDPAIAAAAAGVPPMANGHRMSAGAFGCFHSHRAAWAAIAASGAWFARKFDSATDDFFLDPAAFSASGAAAE